MSKPRPKPSFQLMKGALHLLLSRGKTRFRTADVVEAIDDGRPYTVDFGIPVHCSWNAGVGKALKRYMEELGIVEVAKKQRFTTHDGRKTTGSVWEVQGISAASPTKARALY